MYPVLLTSTPCPQLQLSRLTIYIFFSFVKKKKKKPPLPSPHTVMSTCLWRTKFIRSSTTSKAANTVGTAATTTAATAAAVPVILLSPAAYASSASSYPSTAFPASRSGPDLPLRGTTRVGKESGGGAGRESTGLLPSRLRRCVFRLRGGICSAEGRRPGRCSCGNLILLQARWVFDCCFYCGGGGGGGDLKVMFIKVFFPLCFSCTF